MPTPQQIEAGNAALIDEAVFSVHHRIARNSTRLLRPRGIVNVWHDKRGVRVMVNYGASYRLGYVKPDGSVEWEATPQTPRIEP